ncbi:MAG TPA: cytochrome b/b6 domain-containing protein [Roseiarcus sp.]|jgi:cytochrome b561
MSTKRSALTRVLHLALLIVVLHQLLSSLWTEMPPPGEAMGWPLYLHERAGIAGVAILGLFWVWLFARGLREPSLGRLFPWFSPARVAAVFADVANLLRALVRLRRPPLELDALASATHGLGLLVASWMALTGGLWFFVFEGGSYGRTVLGLHRLAANLMWAYLIGHATVAVLHQALGDDIFSRMFWSKSRRAVAAERRS